MLILAIALSAVSPAPLPETQRARRAATTKVVRTRVPARAQPGKVRLPIVTATTRDPNDRYRLTDLPDETPNGKMLAVRNTGMACGLTGAPVCPSKGTPVLRAPLEGDE